MKKVIKRFFSVLLLCTLIVACFPFHINAVEGSSSLKHTLENDALSYIARYVDYTLLYHDEDLRADTIMETISSNRVEALTDEANLSKQSILLDGCSYSVAQLCDRITNFERCADYLKYIRTAQNIERYEFTYNAHVVESEIAENTASVRVYTDISYKYSPDSPETTYEGDYYTVWFAKVGALWCIANVSSEANTANGLVESVENYSELIAQFDAWQERRANISSAVENHAAPIETESTVERAAAIGTYDRLYNADNAIAYAYTYTTGSYYGGQNNSAFINSNFCDYTYSGGNCQNFVSQCVWAGFGGSDTASAINSRLFPMDTNESHSWWSTNGSSSGAWKACDTFRAYLRTCNSGTSNTGMITNYTSDSASECSTSFAELGLSTSSLYGSLLYVNKNSSGYTHVVLIVGANGTNFDEVFFCGNSPMRKWKKLSDEYTPSPTYCVIKPRAMKNGRGCSHSFPGSTNFCSRCGYNRMRVTPTMVRPIAQGTSLRVGGRANINCFRMALCVTSPSGSETWYEMTNTSSMYSAYTFSQKGLYTIKVVARDLDPDLYPSSTRTADNVFKIRVY